MVQLSNRLAKKTTLRADMKSAYGFEPKVIDSCAIADKFSTRFYGYQRTMVIRQLAKTTKIPYTNICLLYSIEEMKK